PPNGPRADPAYAAEQLLERRHAHRFRACETGPPGSEPSAQAVMPAALRPWRTVNTRPEPFAIVAMMLLKAPALLRIRYSATRPSMTTKMCSILTTICRMFLSLVRGGGA